MAEVENETFEGLRAEVIEQGKISAEALKVQAEKQLLLIRACKHEGGVCASFNRQTHTGEGYSVTQILCPQCGVKGSSEYGGWSTLMPDPRVVSREEFFRIEQALELPSVSTWAVRRKLG